MFDRLLVQKIDRKLPKNQAKTLPPPEASPDDPEMAYNPPSKKAFVRRPSLEGILKNALLQSTHF